MKTALPIELISTSLNRKTFQWQQTITTPVGRQIVNHVGSVPASIEPALLALIQLAKEQQQELIRLRMQVEQPLSGTITQSEPLSKSQSKSDPVRKKATRR